MMSLTLPVWPHYAFSCMSREIFHFWTEVNKCVTKVDQNGILGVPVKKVGMIHCIFIKFQIYFFGSDLL